MEGIEKITEDLQNTVTKKMEEVTGSFVSKEEFDAQKDEIEAQKAENLTLKNELTAKEEIINANKESIEALDTAMAEFKTSHTQVEEEELNYVEGLAKKISKGILEAVNGAGQVVKTVFKAGADVHTIDDGVNPAQPDNIRTWFAQLFAGISMRKRSRAEWVNGFSSVSLDGYELQKFAIKDDAALPVKVGECELKPTSKVDLELYIRKACKVAESFCFSDEFRMTFRNIFNTILDIFRNRIRRTVPLRLAEELIAQSVDFQNTLAVTLPSTANAVDAIEAAICETEEVTNCTIDQVHMSPRTFKGLKSLKDDNGRPLFSCCNGDTSAIFGNGITVYENNDLPDADGVLYLDSSVVSVAANPSISVRDISDKDDALTNKNTILLETWVALLVHPCDQACVVYDTLTDIKTALGVV